MHARLARVYFRISLKRGKHIEANFKGGKSNSKGWGAIHIGKSQFPRGGGAKAPPEINPASFIYPWDYVS
jgi:hypothetical protein